MDRFSFVTQCQVTSHLKPNVIREPVQSLNVKSTLKFIIHVVSLNKIGHLDEGEDAITAAQRETEEEAGLSSDSYEILQGSEFPLILEVLYCPAQSLKFAL